MDRGRVYNSFRNFLFGAFSQIAALLLAFIVRSVFIRYLSLSYLGLNGLFTNVLTILSLAELGFGTVMIHALYRPLAENNEEKIQAYMQFYAKVYRVIGLIVAFAGIALMPFLDYLIKGREAIDINIELLYGLYLLESVSSYFFAYKRSILNADQKAYICSWVHFKILVIRSVLQILVLILFQDFICYILIQILSTFLENVYLSYKVNRMYPYLKIRQKIRLTKEELNSIKKNVYALILSNIGRVTIKGSSNIIISAFVGITVVGLYSNYVMITGAVIMILSQVFSAMTGSVGNFLAKEDSSKHLELFERLDFLNFWLYGVCGICIYVFINPVIGVWIGKEFTLDKVVVLVISLNFVLEGFLYSLWLFRSTMGLFVQGKYRPIFSAIINICVSVFLGHSWGIVGVLLGTTVARLAVNAWYDPYIIYKYGLSTSVFSYYKAYLYRFALIALIVVGSDFLIGEYVNNLDWLRLMGIIIGYVFLLNVFMVLVFRRNQSFIYYQSLVVSVFNKLKKG